MTRRLHLVIRGLEPDQIAGFIAEVEAIALRTVTGPATLDYSDCPMTATELERVKAKTGKATD
ncbi:MULTISPECIES: hypothetical protein [Rhodopseudomonas]|nr:MULTISPECIES: hypothetical protein [Rhodopseudomonas]MDF3811045.1 hypothetical protein [Rhodopseudomonas sp. BAL398]WOK15941.1 hypothetical protein RBJ75_17410 [Rhodopseudomonas sp. BAL398]